MAQATQEQTQDVQSALAGASNVIHEAQGIGSSDSSVLEAK
jgi:hypothetical protein